MQTVQKIILLIMSVFLCACNVQREEEPAEKIVVSPGFVEPAAESPQKTENRIVVVFGYGYTDSPFYENTLSLLETHFGLDKGDGLILPLAFPRDFNYEGVSGRISSLPDIIQGKKIKALIVLGAPEGAHRSLAVIQDRSLTDPSYSFPVLSLFPQDDVLGIEAGSHAVIDFAPFGSGQAMGEEAGLQHLDLIPSILLLAIKKAPEFPQTASSVQIQSFIKSMLGSSWQTELSIDPETSLRSKNHFLISLIEQDLIDEPLVSGLSLISGN